MGQDTRTRSVALRDAWTSALSTTDSLFALVREAALYDRPIAERHRLVFYLGHLEAFEWNLIGRDALGLGAVDPELDRLFAFGIDPVDGALPSDGAGDWPKLEHVRNYANRARNAVNETFAEERTQTAFDVDFEWIVRAAIEHRLMHAETLAYLVHELPKRSKRSPPSDAHAFLAPPEPRLVTIPAGHATLGRARGKSFAWDNEFDATGLEVEEFAIDAYPVTNAEFARFIAAGGYGARELWSPADWTWKAARGLAHPHTWFERDGRWWYRGVFEDRPLPLDWPVHVSHAEATAFTHWRNARLPTEAEWQRAAYGTPASGERSHAWGAEAPRVEHGNFGMRRFDPTPVQAHPAGSSAFGVHDLVGNGWEWTRTAFGAFPGFEAQAFYPGYSAPFFDGRHFVLKGASMRTADTLVRRSFRNWFQPHYPHVPAKFRCVAT